MSDDHYRKHLPETRRSITHRVEIQSAMVGATDVYITVGYYDDGALGEVFVGIGKQGSTLKGAIDGWAIMVSVALQYGVPLEAVVGKFSAMAFEPSGMTSNPEISTCSSVFDYVVRWLAMHASITPEET
jgi:ribonucleoside-diphosphate reductase alpha chain